MPPSRRLWSTTRTAGLPQPRRYTGSSSKRFPDHPAALNNLGLIAPPGEALGLLQRAVAAEPRYVDALVNLSSVLQASGAREAAAATFQRALALIPDEPASLFQLAYILQSQGRDGEAAAQYERAIMLRPDFGAALCNLGTLHNAAERTSAKRQTATSRALAADPTPGRRQPQHGEPSLKSDGRLRGSEALP